MKRLWLIGLSALILSACGGGGGTNIVPSTPAPHQTATPTPSPTQTPVQYTAKLVFTGFGTSASAQSLILQSDLRTVDTTSSPAPIMIVSPISNQGNVGGIYGGVGGEIQAEVSPTYTSSPTPTTTFASTDSHASLHTPSPGVTPPPGVLAENAVVSDGTPNVQSAGTVTGTIGTPIDQTPSVQSYTYMPVSWECRTPMNPGSAQAFRWTGTAWVSTTQSMADGYLTGPQCDTPSSETDATLHVPGGCAIFSTDTPFYTLTASQWTNTSTAIDLLAALTFNPDHSQNDEFVCKTADGTNTFKLSPVMIGNSPGIYAAGVEVSGVGVDGF